MGMKKDWQKIYYISILSAIALIFLSIALLPFYPKISWYFSHPEAPVVETTEAGEAGLLDFSTSTDDLLVQSITPVADTPYRIFIPTIGVDMEIIINEKNEKVAFRKGAWHIPGSAEPNTESGNVVIAAHRFLYTSGPRTFYFLDKLKVGDSIVVRWNNQDFVYRVTETKVVPPTAVEILSPTTDATLTLFTCTPVYTTKNRLVIRAILASAQAVDN
jgi:LPXTG-site transpeptidase (sortase) family protein